MDSDPVLGAQMAAERNGTLNDTLKTLAAMDAENRKTFAQNHALEQATNTSVLEMARTTHINRLKSAARSHALFMEMIQA